MSDYTVFAMAQRQHTGRSISVETLDTSFETLSARSVAGLHRVLTVTANAEIDAIFETGITTERAYRQLQRGPRERCPLRMAMHNIRMGQMSVGFLAQGGQAARGTRRIADPAAHSSIR